MCWFSLYSVRGSAQRACVAQTVLFLPRVVMGPHLRAGHFCLGCVRLWFDARAGLSTPHPDFTQQECTSFSEGVASLASLARPIQTLLQGVLLRWVPLWSSRPALTLAPQVRIQPGPALDSRRMGVDCPL